MKNILEIILSNLIKKQLHRVVLSVFLMALAIQLSAGKAVAQDVTLQWDSVSSADYYVIYYGTSSGNYTQTTGSIASSQTQYTISGLTDATWYFSVKAFNTCGNSSDYSDEISANPIYSPLSISIASPLTATTITQGESVNFLGTVSGGASSLTYNWNFGSGGPADSSVEDPGNVVFDTPGTYTVTFTVTDSMGSVETASVIVYVTQAYVDTNPTATITSPSSDVTVTVGGSVDFQGNVANGNAPYTYAWSFGSSGISSKTVEDPGSLSFSTIGTYTVTFTATDNDGDVSFATRTVTVVAADVNPVASIDSPSANVSITAGGSVNFQATVTSGNAPFTYLWTFGTSGIANKSVEDPGSLVFSTVGTYTVTFTVTDSNGDTSSATRTVTVTAPDVNPTASITSPSADTTITAGGSVDFQGTVTSGNAPFTYLWTFGTSGIANKTVEDPGSLTFSTAGTYTVTFTVTDSDGDISSATRTITVNAPTTTTTTTTSTVLKAVIDSPATSISIAQGGSVNFQGTVTGGKSPYKYRWYFGKGGPSRLSVEDPGNVAFPTTGSYSVSFTATDSVRKSSTAYVTVTVTAKTANAMTANTTLVSPVNGETVTLTPVLETDLSTVNGNTQWQVSTDTAFDNVVLDVTLKSGAGSLNVPALVLNGNTTYYWRMKQNRTDSATSDWTPAQTFVTGPETLNDNDGNGVPDSQETADTIDLNNDGTADHSQDIIKTVKSYDGKTSIGLLKVENVLDIEVLEAMDENAIADTNGKPESLTTGLVGFRILTNAPGETVVIGICLEDAAPANTGWFKYDTILGWQDYSSNTWFSSDRKTLYVELTDGGDGDADGIVNGVIVDPAGLGDNTTSTTAGVEAGDTAGGGKGCFITTASGSIDWKSVALLALVFAGAIASAFRKREASK